MLLMCFWDFYLCGSCFAAGFPVMPGSKELVGATHMHQSQILAALSSHAPGWPSHSAAASAVGARQSAICD